MVGTPKRLHEWHRVRNSKMGNAFGRPERKNPESLTGETRRVLDGRFPPSWRQTLQTVTLTRFPSRLCFS